MKRKPASSPIRILEGAISDVGAWAYWAHSLPRSFQVEFVGVQLHKRAGPRVIDPLAIRFLNPRFVGVLRHDTETRVPRDWFKRLGSDRWTPQGINAIAFNDPVAAQSAVANARSIVKYFGKLPTKSAWSKASASMALSCSNVGLVIAADSFEIVSLTGKISRSSVMDLYKSWWRYWKRYHKVKGTKSALEYDSACEATIPAG